MILQVKMLASSYVLITAFLIIVIKEEIYVVASTCQQSTDSLNRLVYDCNGNHFVAFPSNIPRNTLVLLLRRTMISPIVPSFQAIGLEKLQILDLSWNFIYTFSKDTFKNMTSLLSLDIRSNNVLISAPRTSLV